VKIELRNVKHAEFASQETNCFSATVYIDGQKAGEVSNEGQGGSDHIHPHALRERLDAYASTLPKRTWRDAGIDQDGEYPQDAESIIADLLETILAERRVKRLMRSRLLYTKAGAKGIYQTRSLKPDVLARKVAECRALMDAGKPLPEAEKCLNAMPLADAVRLFRSHDYTRCPGRAALPSHPRRGALPALHRTQGGCGRHHARRFQPGGLEAGRAVARLRGMGQRGGVVRRYVRHGHLHQRHGRVR
jgi:hypothetical protein